MSACPTCGRPWNPDALTAREMAVARLVATGLTNAQIGESLSISRWTVKEYVLRIYAKVGCHNRVQLGLALAAGTVEERERAQ